MNSQELRSALKKTPFRPFTVRMADGRAFEVRHHDFLLLDPHGITAFVFAPTGDEFSILDVALMKRSSTARRQRSQPRTR